MSQTLGGRAAVIAIAALLVVLAVTAGWLIARGDASLLRDVSVENETITPNADGDGDATPIRYELSSNATVSIFFEDEEGNRYYFRQEQPRGVGEYEVLFSGVVDGYGLPGETVEGDILARLLQDGRYTWTITATGEAGGKESVSGELVVAQADPELPEMRNFSLDKSTFTPNQDGIDDRVSIQFFLPKETTQTRVLSRRSRSSTVSSDNQPSPSLGSAL